MLPTWTSRTSWVRARTALGLSQTELAKAAGVHVRQIARYEAGEQQPALSVAVALADALGISIAQLAGQVSYELDLGGEWWCAWQTWKDEASSIDTHPMEIHERGELLQLDAERAVPVDEGSYRWRGELRLLGQRGAHGLVPLNGRGRPLQGNALPRLASPRVLRLGAVGRHELRRPSHLRLGSNRAHRGSGPQGRQGPRRPRRRP